MNNMVMYAFGRDSRDGIMKAIKRYVLYKQDATIWGAKYMAKKWHDEWPNCEIFVLDSRVGLKDDYNDAAKANTVESWMVFYDNVKREGLKIE